MPRAKVILDPNSFYHITARALNREWFRLDLPSVWHIFGSYLAFISRNYSVQVHDFVLMSNHFHLLARFPENNIDEALLYFMRESSRAISRDSQRINQTFGGRHHKCRIASQHHLMNVYKYIHQNPIRANIVDRVEEYKYSTLRAKLGLDPTLFPLCEDLLLTDLNHRERHLQWLNHLATPENVDFVRRALRRGEFTLPVDRSTKKPPKIIDQLI